MRGDVATESNPKKQPQNYADALARSKAEFEAMFKSIPDAVIFTDTDRRIVMCNPAVSKMFGYSDNELTGNTTEMLYADPDDFKDQGRRRYRTGPDAENTPYEIRYKHKDGHFIWTETLGTQVVDTNGTVIGFIGMCRDISKRKQTEKALIESETYNRMLFEQSPIGLALCRLNGELIDINPTYAEIIGYSVEETLKLSYWEITPEKYAEKEQFQLQSLEKTGQYGPYEKEYIHKDGHLVPVRLHGLLLEKDGEQLIWSSVEDITAYKQSERALLDATDLRNRFGRILDNSSNEIYVFDAETLHFTQVNKGARHNLGYTMQEMTQLTPADLKPEYSRDSFNNKIQPLYKGELEQLVFQTWHRRKNGTTYPVEVRLQLSHEESPPVFVAIILDISERIQNEKKLQYMAHHDALTRLPNRVLFNDRLNQALAHAKRHERSVAVLFLDLDRFKIINDTLGHDVGDRALQALSDRLTSCVREGDTVSRLGGDEFAIVLEDISSVDNVATTARKILDILSQPFPLNNEEFIITTSIGISMYPSDGKDSQSLLKHADIAMYRAKDVGRNTYQFYSSEMSTKAFERLNLETSLRHALEREEFTLYYQPQKNQDNGKIFGVEALLRWQHPELGLISPNDFVPLLEETGLILPVGEWVMHTACLQAYEWNNSGLGPLRVSVNISGRQISNSNFIATIKQTLEDSKLDPALLELEMTESILIQNIQTTVKTLQAISETGVGLAIDDFGTGYSSLSYLKRFPIDTLKIDRSFVHDLPHDPNDATLVEAIIAMGQALHLNVIAEGVETQQQVDFLQKHNCDNIQGYLISRPLPAQELTTLLQK